MVVGVMTVGYIFKSLTENVQEQNAKLKKENVEALRKKRRDEEERYAARGLEGLIANHGSFPIALAQGECVMQEEDTDLCMPIFKFDDHGKVYLTNRQILFVGGRSTTRMRLADVVSILEDEDFKSITIHCVTEKSPVILTVAHPLMWKKVYERFKAGA